MEPSSLFPCMIFHEVNKVDYALYIRQHITELRMKRNVSEYQMSLDLGQNKNYIQGISSGKALPSMSQFFNICDYFNITPMQFFDTESLHPELVSSILSEIGVRVLSPDGPEGIGGIALALPVQLHAGYLRHLRHG